MRRVALLLFGAWVAALAGCGGGDPAPAAVPAIAPPPSAAPALFPRLSPAAVAERMNRLVAPPGTDYVLRNTRPGGMDAYESLAIHAAMPADVIADLAMLAPPSVEAELLRVARTHALFVVRCRAFLVLARRGHSATTELAAALWGSPTAAERYAVWVGLRHGRFDEPPVPRIPASEVFARLEAESDARTRREIRSYLTLGGDASAAPALAARLATERDDRARADIVAYLGAVHDATAAPSLVARLETERDDDAWAGIVEYLTEVGDRSAVPALRARLEVEMVPRRREAIVAYLGAARDAASVPSLLAILAQGDSAPAGRVVAALGRIGDPRAAPAVIAAEERVGPEVWCDALADLDTPETIDALIAHLEEAAATDALVRAGSRRAIPALERFLAGRDEPTRGDETSTNAAPAEPDAADDGPRSRRAEAMRRARIALARLRSPDPLPELLAIVEDPHATVELRRDALEAARADDRLLDRHADRLVALYAKETDPDLLDQCLSTFSESRLSGVTEAMLHHADVWVPYMKDSWSPLVNAINRRLGTDYRTLEEVRARPVR